jgi:hypothetical protein
VANKRIDLKVDDAEMKRRIAANKLMEVPQRGYAALIDAAFCRHRAAAISIFSRTLGTDQIRVQRFENRIGSQMTTQTLMKVLPKTSISIWRIVP